MISCSHVPTVCLPHGRRPPSAEKNRAHGPRGEHTRSPWAPLGAETHQSFLHFPDFPFPSLDVTALLRPKEGSAAGITQARQRGPLCLGWRPNCRIPRCNVFSRENGLVSRSVADWAAPPSPDTPLPGHSLEATNPAHCPPVAGFSFPCANPTCRRRLWPDLRPAFCMRL